MNDTSTTDSSTSSWPPSTKSAATRLKTRAASEPTALEAKMAKVAEAATELSKKLSLPIDQDGDSGFSNFIKAELKNIFDEDIKDNFKIEVTKMLMVAKMESRNKHK